jgi:hypothetical protein
MTGKRKLSLRLRKMKFVPEMAVLMTIRGGQTLVGD